MHINEGELFVGANRTVLGEIDTSVSDTYYLYRKDGSGKGEPNQVIRVGHSAPPCLFKNIEIFGGAS